MLISATIFLVPFFVYTDVRFISHAKIERENLHEIEDFFISNNVVNAQEVYTCDYELYFVSLFPYRPLFNGGWGRIATYKYSTFFPELSVVSLQDFYDDCLRYGVRYVVLNEAAPRLAGFLNDIYTESLIDDRFNLTFERGGRKIFRVLNQS